MKGGSVIGAPATEIAGEWKAWLPLRRSAVPNRGKLYVVPSVQIGTVKVKLLPLPTWLVTVISPP